MSQPIFLVGPTCVGKSTVAIALARSINAEIVSCDSMQVYRGMDIGTAKPTKKERESVPHHMIDVVDITQEYNVAQYVIDANRVIDELQRRKKIPLVVGGTGLYFKALIDGLFTGPAKSMEIREKLGRLGSLHEELKKVDPVSADRIKPQDKRRIIRALEVFYITGKPISSFQTQWKEEKNAFVIGLNRERGDLYKRIDDRVEDMFRCGFIDEVRQLKELGLTENKTASRALGYKEVLDYLSGQYTLDDVKELTKRNTRRFAKRQLTWFNKDGRVRWILIQQEQEVDETIEKILRWREKKAL